MERRRTATRLADLVPENERLKIDLAIAKSGLESYQKELARLRSRKHKARGIRRYDCPDEVPLATTPRVERKQIESP